MPHKDGRALAWPFQASEDAVYAYVVANLEDAMLSIETDK
jgi:hypothetical protein